MLEDQGSAAEPTGSGASSEAKIAALGPRLIEVENLRKHFGSIVAVDGISFELRRATQVNDAAVKRLVQVVGTGTFDDVAAADKVSFADNARSVHFELANGVSIDVTLGTKDGRTWARYVPTAAASSGAAARVKDFAERAKSYVFALPDYQVSALAIGIDQLTAASEAHGSDLPPPPPTIEQTR